MQSTFIIGILNGMFGTAFTAMGYSHRKYWHLKGEGSGWWIWLVFLVIGTISSAFNFALLSASSQAGFPCFTIIWTIILGTTFNHEAFVSSHLWSLFYMVIGILLTVNNSDSTKQEFDVEYLNELLTRPSKWVLTTLSVILALVFYPTYRRNDSMMNTRFYFCVFVFMAGVFGGFTWLNFKILIEIIEAYVRDGANQTLYFVPMLYGVFAPLSLYFQVKTLDKTLKRFDNISASSSYSAMLILQTAYVGFVYLEEGRNYSGLAGLWYFVGVLFILRGVYLQSLAFERDLEEEQFDFPPTSFLEPTIILDDCNDMKDQIVELIKSAQDTIFYSYFLCDFTYKISERGDTMLSLFNDAAERGVNVFILANPYSDYGSTSLEWLSENLNRRINVHSASGSLGPTSCEKRCSNNEKYGYHHQKYLCCDGKRIMVTGTDINDERNGWLMKNRLGYFWHELAVVSRCTDDMMMWCRRNHEAIDVHPPMPLALGIVEHDAAVAMILDAKHSIHVENQILITALSWGQNRIGHAIVRRMVKAIKAREEFKVVIVTNLGQPDEPSYWAQLMTKKFVTASICGMVRLARKEGVSESDISRRMVVIRLESPENILVKVHTNVIIVDEMFALRSSSNMTDRSWSTKPTDTELGIFLRGEPVQKLQKTLIRRYVGKDVTFEQFFQACKRSQGLTRAFPKFGYWDRILGDLLVTFLVGFKPSALGGAVAQKWTTQSHQMISMAGNKHPTRHE